MRANVRACMYMRAMRMSRLCADAYIISYRGVLPSGKGAAAGNNFTGEDIFVYSCVNMCYIQTTFIYDADRIEITQVLGALSIAHYLFFFFFF